MQIIPKGATFTISTGAYSDYTVTGVFRALADLDPSAIRDEYLTTHPEQRKMYEFKESEFLADLTRKNLIEAVPSYEWHLGDYSSAHEMEVYDCR